MIKLSFVNPSPEAAEEVKKLVVAGKIGQSDIIESFENKFAKWIGSKYAIAVSSGTMADAVALAVLKFLNPLKNEVIVPAHTFIAQANAILYNGLKPVFIDSEVSPLPFVNEKTLCWFPVHLLGVPSDTFPSSVPSIEDSCEALGSEMGHIKCGTFGAMGTFSFFPSHTITTGEGGMIVTNSEDYNLIARRIRNHGKINSYDFRFDTIGFNAKMTSLQACLGYYALDTIDDVIKKRRSNYFSLGGMDPIGCKVSPHAFPVFFENEQERDRKLAELRMNDIECRNFFSSVPTQEAAYKFLGHKIGEFPIAEDAGRRALYVPVHQGLKEEDIRKIRSIIYGQEKETSREVLA